MIISLLFDAGEFRRALRLFMQMKKSFSMFNSMSQFRIAHGISHGGRPIIHSITSDNSVENDKRIENEESADDDHLVLHSIDLTHHPPKPTLVTYSTLMSRAVGLGKPRVALRLWKLLQNQPDFYVNAISIKQRKRRMKTTHTMNQIELRELEKEEKIITPDVIFCNTLMNAYAKMVSKTEHGSPSLHPSFCLISSVAENDFACPSERVTTFRRDQF